MNFGLPYQGSKNAIVPWVVSLLPPAETFVDLFAGGCAVTHGAMISGKYQNFICNDIGDAPKLFQDAIEGKYKNERRWISREKFFAEKDNDPYIRIVWSFGNNQRDYMYAKDVEPWKKALHWARVYGDCSLLREMGIPYNGSMESIRKHERECREKYAAWYRDCFNATIGAEIAIKQLESLQRLQRLQSLQSLQRSYDEVEIPKNACVYCDPPYRGTGGYLCEFDFGKFDEWLRNAPFPVYISEYSMPSDFVEVGRCAKRGLACATQNNLVCEKVFVHEKWANKIERTTLF